MTRNLPDAFVPPNSPILIQKALEVPFGEIGAPATKKIIETMLRAAYGQQTSRKKPVLVGLAAPQVGISTRIILVDIGADGHGGVSSLQIYINPKISWKSDHKIEWYEGCYSTDCVCGIVARPDKVKIHAYNPDGKVIEEEFKGYIARIFQHEIDHLNGIEFVSHIKNDRKLHWVEENEFPKYRDKEAWRSWPKKCSRSRWHEIKGIT